MSLEIKNYILFEGSPSPVKGHEEAIKRFCQGVRPLITLSNLVASDRFLHGLAAIIRRGRFILVNIAPFPSLCF